jgi:hypothetical protein
LRAAGAKNVEGSVPGIASGLGRALRSRAARGGISLVGALLAAPFQEADYRRVLAAAVQEGAEALVISDLPYNFANRRLIVQLASEGRLPAIYPWRGLSKPAG